MKKKENLLNLNFYTRLQWSTVASITVSDIYKFLRLIVLCKKKWKWDFGMAQRTFLNLLNYAKVCSHDMVLVVWEMVLTTSGIIIFHSASAVFVVSDVQLIDNLGNVLPNVLMVTWQWKRLPGYLQVVQMTYCHNSKLFSSSPLS